MEFTGFYSWPHLVASIVESGLPIAAVCGKAAVLKGEKSNQTNVVSILLIIFHLQEGQIRERSCQEEPEVEQQQQPAPLQHTCHRGPRSSSGHRSVAGSVSSLAQPLPPPAELPALDMPAFDFQR